MNRLTVTVGHPSGIPVRIHLSWLLLVGWIGWVAIGLPHRASLKLLFLFLLLVLCVLLHELAHASAGRAMGLHVTGITLYPFGGLSTFEDLPVGETRTAMVFLAGPAANLTLAGILWLAGGRLASVHLAAPAASDPILAWLVWSNLSLGLLNLAPVLPLDGGQIVQTLLARRLGELGAGRVLGAIGQVGGIVVLVWGLAGRPWLVLIGLFVVVGATAELQRIQPLLLARNQRVRDVMRTAVVTVDAGVPLSELREISRRSPGADFVLTENGRPAAYLPAARLWRRTESAAAGPAIRLAEPLGFPVDPETSLAEAAELMKAHGSSASPVIDRDAVLMGVLLEASARRSLSLLKAFSTRAGGGGSSRAGRTSPEEGRGDPGRGEDSGAAPR